MYIIVGFAGNFFSLIGNFVTRIAQTCARIFEQGFCFTTQFIEFSFRVSVEVWSILPGYPPMTLIQPAVVLMYTRHGEVTIRN